MPELLENHRPPLGINNEQSLKGLHKVSRRYRCATCHPLHFLKLTNYRAIVFTFSHLSRDNF